MRYFLLFILIITLAIPVSSQKKTDSLLNVLSHTKDENKAYIYDQLAQEYFYNNIILLKNYAKKADSLAKIYQIDSTRVKALNKLTYSSIQLGEANRAKQYNKEAINLATRKNLTKGKITSRYYTGFIYYAIGQTDSSLYHLNKAYKEAIAISNPILKLQCLNTIAINYLSQGNYNVALKNFTKAFNIADSLNLKTRIINLSLNIGTTLLYNEELEKAITYFEKVIASSDTTSASLAYASALNNIGTCHNNKKNYKAALEYFNKSLSEFSKLNNKLHIAQVYANLGQTNLSLNRTEAAEDYLQHAISLNREGKSSGQLIINLILLGELQIQQKEYLKAKYSIDEANQLIKTNKVNNNKTDLYKIYSKYYKATKQLNKALYYKEKELFLRDSIFQKERQLQISELETKFQTQLKENENENLRKDLSLNKLQVEKQTQLRNFFFILAVLVFILVVILLNRARIKKRAHKIIEKQSKELKVANQTQNKFFSIVAHDLKAPFSALIGLSQILSLNYDELNDSERKTYINDLYNASKNSFALAENLLTWSRVQKGNISIKKEILDLPSIVQDSILPLQASAKLKNISLNNLIELSPLVLADKRSIETVIVNLVNNALKFTPEGGKINITANSENKHLIISINDTGVGMSQKQIDALFRIDKNSSTNGTNNELGTGLGLILCKEFINMNDGEIWVKSELGVGSTFSFSIPLN
nr:tetratricopeptide repeat protein [uncultured Marinifilum sp.]